MGPPPAALVALAKDDAIEIQWSTLNRPMIPRQGELEEVSTSRSRATYALPDRALSYRGAEMSKTE